MKLADLVRRIVELGHLPDGNDITVIRWSIENNIEESFAEFIQAVKEDDLRAMEVKGKDQQGVPVKKLENSQFFIGLANSYTQIGSFDKAIKMFEEMLRKGSNESTLLNDYGVALLNQILATKVVKKENIDLARKLIFDAFAFDKKVSAEWYHYPAYKNLCFLRAIEGTYYNEQKDSFAAFLLGWMSIEMTLYRIWHQFLTLKSATGIDDLMRWDSDSIIEVLFLGEVGEELKRTRSDLEMLKKTKTDLDTLKGVRNHLLHGDIDNPTSGQSTHCINTALKLVPLFQSVNQDLELAKKEKDAERV